MTPKRAYLLMLVGIGLITLAFGGSAYLAKTLLTKKSNELLVLKADLIAYNQQQSGLVQAKKDIATYDDLYTIAKTVVPETKNQAETVRQIVKLAQENSVTLGSITFPSSTLGTAAKGKSAPSNLSLTPSPSSSVNIGTANLSQLVPVTGTAGVYVLKIDVASDSNHPATYPQLISFLSALENNRLTAEVTNVSIIPDTNNVNKFSFTLSLNSYIKP